MRTLGLRHISVIAIAIGSAACTLLASLDDHPSGAPGANEDGSTSGNEGGAQEGGGPIGDAGADSPQGPLTVTFTPDKFVGRGGDKQRVHFSIQSVGGLGSPVSVKIGLRTPDAGAVDAGPDANTIPATASPASFDLPKENAVGDFDIQIDPKGQYGGYDVPVRVVTTTASGAAVDTTATYPLEVASAPGTIDVGFGTTGSGYFDFCPVAGAQSCQPGDLFVYPDGRWLLAGSYFTANGNGLLLARFQPDGSLDTTFGGGQGFRAIATTSLPTGQIGNFQNPGLNQLTDGSFIIGFLNSGHNAFIRVSEDGVMDTSFGSGGALASPLTPGQGGAGAIALFGNDAGFGIAGEDFNTSQLGLVGYSYNGQQRYSQNYGFAASQNAGVVMVDPANPMRALVGGQLFTAQTDVASLIVRQNNAGQLDPTFGTNGSGRVALKTQAGVYQDEITNLAAHNGGYLAAGYFAGQNVRATIMLWRLEQNGTPDPNFGSQGLKTLDAGTEGIPSALVVLSDNSILVNNGYLPTSFFIARLTANGQPAATSATGAQLASIPGIARRMVPIEAEQRLLVIGYDSSGSSTKIRIARYWLK